MSVLQHVRIQGHRRLRDVSLDLRPLAVLIGPNGSGKSSFLEVWRLLSRGAKKELGDAFRDAGGFSEVLTRDHADEWMLSASVSVPQPTKQLFSFPSSLTYDLTIQRAGWGYGIKQESVTKNSPKTSDSTHQLLVADLRSIQYFSGPDSPPQSPSPNHIASELAIAQLPFAIQELQLLQAFFSSCGHYRPINVDSYAPVRMPQQLSPTTSPGEDGESLISALYTMRETDRPRYEMVEDTLSAAFSDFERLDFPLAANGVAGLTWKDRSYTRPLSCHQLSEGTVRFLWLTALLSSAEPTLITLLDEPEVSLHPQLLALLVDMLRQASKHTNLFVATHSERLVRFLEPNEVLIADLENGEARFTWGDQLDLDAWLADYGLDELWRMGQLGGRP